ncbi:hypothetical protein [Paenibacillus piri]|uniref:Amidohydrolase n=1 Tax=Paenibacillus piri TaxID=2547395 RepID=A0A4R5KZQ9_9BACL|nr:hypothetical protein [Paenibacillus piri]TDG00736.1 hypothetical protein E1757_03695 [Paenibacillus piri]
MTPEWLAKEAGRRLRRLIEIRRELHRHPELSMQEYETEDSPKGPGIFGGAGIPTIPVGLPVGVLAEIEGGGHGPTIALRADLDALLVKEETGQP